SADRSELALEGEVPVVGRPLPDMLELGGELLGGDELLLGEDQDGLGLDAPRVDLRLALLLRPDSFPVFEHLRLHPGDSAERLDAGDVEDDLIPGLDLLRLPATAL